MAFDRSKTEVERVCRDGEYIVREGEMGREMFVIKSGQVRITKNVGDDEMVLATLKKGDFFGEMSLLESLARHADAVSVGDTRLLVIQPGGLLLRIRRDPTFAMEMLQRLSNRIRVQNDRLVRALEVLEKHGVEDEVARQVLASQVDATKGAR
jgi:CRP-like cAMP-binding protein